MQILKSFRFLTPALALLLLVGSSVQAQEFAQWAKLVSFRPEAKLQEKLQNEKADENGDRPHLLKIERARGNLVLMASSLVVNKMPAIEGRALSVNAFARYLRLHLMEMVDSTKAALALADETQKSAWESETPEGQQLKWIDKVSNTETDMFLADAGTDRWVLSMMSRHKEAQPHMVSGNLQISLTGATPLEGCIIQVRGAVRPTAAATAADEWAAAERFAGVWVDVLEHARAWVKLHDGDCIPELLPPTVSVVPWNVVAKAFHQPTNPWVGIEGTWVSVEKRFRLEFQNESSCDFIEMNKSGKEMRATCTVTRGEGEKVSFVIERSNDNEDLLSFYEFKPSVRAAIIDKKPEPSKLVLSRNSKGKMVGQWYGLAISRDVYGNLQEVKSPSKGPARVYEFIPVGD